MALIKDVSNIDWFDIKNYTSRTRMSQEEWFLELSIRSHYYTMPFTGPKTGSLFGNVKATREYVDNQISLATRYEDVSQWCNGELVFTKPISVGSFFEKLEFTFVSEKIPIAPMAKGELANFNSTRIPHYIDIAAPDELLHECLDLLIKKQRAEVNGMFENPIPLNKRGGVTYVNEKELSLWATCGLLPYLDLYQWCLLTKNTISKRGYGNALHTGTNKVSNPGQSIIETTEPRAKEIWKSLISLDKQICGKWEVKSVDGKQQFVSTQMPNTLTDNHS